MKIFDGLHAFIWRIHTQNNCNTYLIDGDMKILIDPGHVHLFDNVRKNLNAIGVSPDRIDLVIATHGHPDHLEAVKGLGKLTMFAMSAEDL
jgi:flavorubredoxin